MELWNNLFTNDTIKIVELIAKNPYLWWSRRIFICIYDFIDIVLRKPLRRHKKIYFDNEVNKPHMVSTTCSSKSR